MSAYRPVPVLTILFASVVAATAAIAAPIKLNSNKQPAPASPVAPAAVPLDCRAGCHNVAFGDAVWSTDDIFHPSGTGVFQPFLRLQANGQSTTEDGHNTDAKSKDFLNDEKGGIWTHSVPMSAFTPGTVTGYGNTLYFGFALDFGEPASQGDSLISLDALKMCTSNDPSLLKADDCPTTPYKYDLDAGTNREVLLDYLLHGRGNGASDLFVYVPMARFATTDKYFYLYSKFGEKGGAYQADGTFAEWSFFDEPTPAPIPEPGSLLLLAPGLGAVLLRRRITAR